MVKRIVVVDDEQPIAELIVQLLEFEGFAVEHCTDSAQAYRQIKEFAPHLVILDLMMPNLDGWAVLEQLQKDHAMRQVRVIICTAFGQEAFRRKKSLNRLDVPVLLKPFDIEDLLRMVHKTIGSP